MNDQFNENAPMTRGEAPVSGISVPGNLGVGADLVHALDYVVIIQVLFNLAAGEESTPLGVWRQLQTRGIRSAKNANELVGKNAVYESFQRLIGAGYLRRIEVPNEVAGRRPSIAYKVFDNPAWNPDWQAAQVGTDPLTVEDRHDQAREKAQVSPLPGTPDLAFRDLASRNVGSGAFPQVSPLPAFRNVGSRPPHTPQEEVETSSPYPLKRSEGQPARLRRAGRRGRTLLRSSRPNRSRTPNGS